MNFTFAIMLKIFKWKLPYELDSRANSSITKWILKECLYHLMHSVTLGVLQLGCVVCVSVFVEMLLHQHVCVYIKLKREKS